MNKILLSFLFVVSFSLAGSEKAKFDALLYTLQSMIGPSSMSIDERFELNPLITKFLKATNPDEILSVMSELSCFGKTIVSDVVVKKYLADFCKAANVCYGSAKRRIFDDVCSGEGLISAEIECLERCGITADFLEELNKLHDLQLKGGFDCDLGSEDLICFRVYLEAVVTKIFQVVANLKLVIEDPINRPHRAMLEELMKDFSRFLKMYESWLVENPVPAPYKF